MADFDAKNSTIPKISDKPFRAQKSSKKSSEKSSKKPAKKTKSEKAKPEKPSSKSPKSEKPQKPLKKLGFTVKTNKKGKTRHIIYAVLTIVIAVGIISTAYNFIRWRVEVDITDNEINQAREVAAQVKVEDTDQTEIIYSDEADGSPYEKYIKMNLMNVDLTSLKSTNDATVGWIQVPGTRIDYPYVQTTDNDFYLHHSFDKTWNSAGWVFLDYRNRTSLTGNKNNIIYAHGRVDGSMFGTLKNVLDSTWQDNIDNHIVKTSSTSEDALWQVFSVYRTPVTSDYLQTDFSDSNEYVKFLAMLQSRSAYKFQASLAKTDRIITLSTCIGSDDRVVLHAKLIKLSRH